MNTMNSDLPLTHYKNYNIVNLMEVLLLPLFCPLTILPSLHAHSEFAPRANFPIQFSCVDRYLETARTLAHVFKLYINRITLHVIFCKFFPPTHYYAWNTESWRL